MSRPLRILSSDDDEGIRALLFSLLTEHGHEVEFARDGAEVFKNLGRGKYDLLILDVNMPGMNGYKVAEKISGNISNRPRILLFTARNIKEEQLQFAACGADAVIRKGAPCDRIMSVINELFGERTAAKLPPAQPVTSPEGAEPLMQKDREQAKPAETRDKLNEDLQFCLSRMTQVEDLITAKNMRYEEFIRDLLKEKQRTEKNYLEFKRIENEVIKLKNWGYAVAAVAGLGLIRSFFQ